MQITEKWTQNLDNLLADLRVERVGCSELGGSLLKP